MKIKKIQGILLSVGFSAILLGAALFFVLPLLIGKGFEYNGIKVFLEGAKSLFKFDFSQTLTILLSVLLIVTFACVLIWMIVIFSKKRRLHLISMVFDFAAIVLIFVFVSAYLVPEVEFNSTKGVLFKLIMGLEDQKLGKLLSMLVLSFFYIALMFLTLAAFLDIATLVLHSDSDVKEVENVESDPMEGYEDRKAREEALFKACIDTGEFTRYDELEFSEPLEGYTEEPVFEETIVEEESKFIGKQESVKVSVK